MSVLVEYRADGAVGADQCFCFPAGEWLAGDALPGGDVLPADGGGAKAPCPAPGIELQVDLPQRI